MGDTIGFSAATGGFVTVKGWVTGNAIDELVGSAGMGGEKGVVWMVDGCVWEKGVMG